MEQYPRTALRLTLQVEQIISLFYFEFAKNYVFVGELHDFWEFLYVDKGEVEVMADTTRHRLTQGEIIFHKPNEFHSFYANQVVAPNLIVMSFECDSEAMRHFENKIVSLDDEERNLLAQIVKEGMSAFQFPSSVPLVPREDAVVGAEQMVKLNLESFLIRLLRRSLSAPGAAAGFKPLSYASREKSEDEIVHTIMAYMQERLDWKLSLGDMSEAIHVSKTRVKELFKRKTGRTVMEYFSKLKIDRAKTYIREQSCTFTEIAQKLGYSSVHYFSRAFKKETDMTPSEYAKSVKARV